MPDMQSGDVGGRESGLLALAENLAHMAHKLAEALPNVVDEKVRSSLVESMEGIRGVHSSLRSIDLVYDPEHARQVVRHAEGLRRLALATGEVVSDLSLANQQAAQKLAEHIQELENIAKLPSAGGVSSRLQSTVTEARKMAADICGTLNEITSKAARATEGISALENELRSVREKAFLDALTRVHSRSALDEVLAATVRGGESAGPWCFLLAEIDHAAEVIETHGHIVGDALLFKVARTMEDALPQDPGRSFLARYSAMQFAAILRRADLAQARTVAESFRSSLAAARWQRRDKPSRGVVQVTTSLGVAQYHRGDTADNLVQRANQALRGAQEAGGNRVIAV